MVIASAAAKSIVSPEPCPPTASASGRSGVAMFVTLALRVHAARCQNWRAWVLAYSWVSATRSGSAAHGAAPAGAGTAAPRLSRRNASVEGQIAFEPKPSAARWYSLSPLPAGGPPEKTEMMVTFWPSSRRLAMRPPHESAASSGCGEVKTWAIAPEDSIGEVPAVVGAGSGGRRRAILLPEAARVSTTGAVQRDPRRRHVRGGETSS